jgi:ankyrin repeat protein
MEADVDWRDEQDLTALHHAVLSGFEDVVELLLNRGADVNAPSTTAGLPLCLAVLKHRSHIVRLLLDKFRAAVNLADPELGTPLHCAGFTGNCDLVHLLLDHGAEPEPVNRVNLPKLLPYQDDVSTEKLTKWGPWSGDYSWTRITPLIIAVLANNLEMAKLFLWLDNDKRLSTFEHDGDERTGFHFLHAAARWASSDMVALTIVHSASNLDLTDSKGNTALIGATAKNRSDRVRQLLQAGAPRDQCNDHGDTALTLASYYGYHNTLKELIDAGADLELSDKRKMTAIIRASSKGRESCVVQLIKAAASLDCRDDTGDTALTHASSHGFDRCVKKLIDAGASLDIPNMDGETALMRASSKGHGDCVRRLIKAGASIEICDNGGNTALLLASTQDGNGDCVKQLIEAGASLNQRNEKGYTALINASINGKQDCVYQLLRAGAPLATKTKTHDSTALHEAVIGGHSECARMLCIHGADVNARRLSGATPLFCAVANDELECVQMLLEHQADPDLAILASKRKGCTPLLAATEAAKPQSAAIVEALLQAGANVAIRTTAPRHTALHIAAKKDQLQIARSLINAGASTVAVNDYYERPITKAKPDSALYALLQAHDQKHDEERKRSTERQKTRVRA